MIGMPFSHFGPCHRSLCGALEKRVVVGHCCPLCRKLFGRESFVSQSLRIAGTSSHFTCAVSEKSFLNSLFFAPQTQMANTPVGCVFEWQFRWSASKCCTRAETCNVDHGAQSRTAAATTSTSDAATSITILSFTLLLQQVTQQKR